MRLMTALRLIGCATCLTGCASTVTVPRSLTEPEPVPICRIATVKDAGKCIVDYDAALGRSNSKLVQIGALVTP